MSDTIRQKAQAALAEVEEISRVVLPEPKDAGAIVPLAKAEPAEKAEISKRMEEIDMGDTNSIVSFGSAAQAELQEISQSMLQGVRNKDVGPAGSSLRNIVTTIRGFSVSELDVRRERTGITQLLGDIAEAGLQLKDVATRQSSLEDIFVGLVQEEREPSA